MVSLWSVRRTGLFFFVAVLLGVRPDAAATGVPGGSVTFTKAFGAASIPLNGSTSLSFNIQNPIFPEISNVAFTDTLPAGLVVATPNNLTTCDGGTVTAVAGSGTVSLSGAVLPLFSSCTISLNVTGTSAGTKVNTSGPLTMTGIGPIPGPTASITVVAPVPLLAPGGLLGLALLLLAGTALWLRRRRTTEAG